MDVSNVCLFQRDGDTCLPKGTWVQICEDRHLPLIVWQGGRDRFFELSFPIGASGTGEGVCGVFQVLLELEPTVAGVIIACAIGFAFVRLLFFPYWVVKGVAGSYL